jgi:hypothetical protein
LGQSERLPLFLGDTPIISLKSYTTKDFLDDFQLRVEKLPLILSEAAVLNVFMHCIIQFDELVFYPRYTLLKEAYDGAMVDVTDLHIDAISRVYYASDRTIQSVTGELGIMPFISANGAGVGLLDSIVDFFVMQRVLNGLKRYTNTQDFMLWPKDEQGRSFLQVKNPGSLMLIEFLPYFDATLGSWEMYPMEFEFVSTLLFNKVCAQNAVSMMNAIPIGASKEAFTLTKHWDEATERLLKSWNEKSIINYLV